MTQSTIFDNLLLLAKNENSNSTPDIFGELLNQTSEINLPSQFNFDSYDNNDLVARGGFGGTLGTPGGYTGNTINYPLLNVLGTDGPRRALEIIPLNHSSYIERAKDLERSRPGVQPPNYQGGGWFGTGTKDRMPGAIHQWSNPTDIDKFNPKITPKYRGII